MTKPFNSLKHLSNECSGAAAVEFAMILPFFLFLIFANMEMGWTMVQTTYLDRALDLTIRSLRLGQISSPSRSKIEESICKEAWLLADCQDRLTVEFTPITSVASYPSNALKCKDDEGTGNVDVGGRGQTVFVRACFLLSTITPAFGLLPPISKDDDGRQRLVSKTVFTNEPAS